MKKWFKPKLIILTRTNRHRERILETCKNGGVGPGSQDNRCSNLISEAGCEVSCPDWDAS